jgi:flagellar hook assembly protein FlgD
VLSPNGDGVGDTETLVYRVVRPSNVVATLAGPGGAQVTLRNETESPGLHTVGWSGTSGGSPAPEGTWTFTVTGTDDRNVTTTAQRTFSLDDTLSSLALTLDSHGLPTATFKLTRAASVLVQIQRPNGIPVATLRSGPQPAGTEQVTWNGRIGPHEAPGGHYQVAVQATSSVGTSSLAAPFSLPAHKRH